MSTAPADQHPAWSVLPLTMVLGPFFAHLLGVRHQEAAPGCCFILSFSDHFMSNHLETSSTAELSPCHIQWMNVTVSAITESALSALALGNLQCLLPQPVSKRHGWDKRRCKAFSIALHFCFLVPKPERTVTGPLHCPSKLSQHHPFPVLFLLAG